MMRWIRLVPRQGMRDGLLRRLGHMGMTVTEIGGDIFARVGRRHIGWLQDGRLDEEMSKFIDEWKMIEGKPQDHVTDATARWRIATRHLHKHSGLRALEWIMEQAIVKGANIEVSPALDFGKARLATAMQFYAVLDTLDERGVVKIAGKPAKGERGLPWRLEVSPEFLELYKQRKADGSFEPQLKPLPAPAPAPGPTLIMGKAEVHVDIRYVVPGDRGPELAKSLGEFFTEMARKRGMRQIGGIEVRLILAEEEVKGKE